MITPFVRANNLAAQRDFIVGQGSVLGKNRPRFLTPQDEMMPRCQQADTNNGQVGSLNLNFSLA